jgi:hypothetical protein
MYRKNIYIFNNILVNVKTYAIHHSPRSVLPQHAAAEVLIDVLLGQQRSAQLSKN